MLGVTEQRCRRRSTTIPAHERRRVVIGMLRLQTFATLEQVADVVDVEHEFVVALLDHLPLFLGHTTRLVVRSKVGIPDDPRLRQDLAEPIHELVV